MLSAFLLGSGRQWTDAFIDSRPREQRERLRRARDNMASAVGGYVAGALTIALIAGIATYIVLLILGVPFRGPLAVIAGLFSLIPLVGATIAAVLIGVVTLFENFPTATIIWAIWAIVYQQIENHLIQPQIQKRTVNVHPFITIVAVLFGARCSACWARSSRSRWPPPSRSWCASTWTCARCRSRRPSRRRRRRPQSRLPRSLPRMSPAALTRRGLLLLVTAISLYLLAPALLEVFGAFDELDEISPLWFPAMIAPQIGSYACMWGIQRLAVRADRWGPVITSQLASNAFGRVVPGGVAASGAVQYAMLGPGRRAGRRGGIGDDRLVLLLFGTLLALPLLATPAIIGGVAVDPHLTKAALAGAVLFILMVAVGAACVLWDRPLELLGRAAQAIWNRVRRNREPLTGLPERLLHERDIVLRVLGRQWWEALLLAAGRWVLDYLTLIAALYAVGASPRASLVLLAFCAAQLLGTLPLTPGGLGFVEAGPHRNARAGRSGRRRRRRGDARLPPRLVLAADPGGRRRGGRPPAPLRRGGGRAAAGGYAGIGARPDAVLTRFAGVRPKLGRALRRRRSSGGPFCSHHALIAAMAGPMIRFFWKFSVSLTCGSGVSGTGTSRNSQSGSQPSLGSQTSSRSAGTVSLTSWFQRSYASAIGSGVAVRSAPRAALVAEVHLGQEVDPRGVVRVDVVLRRRGGA